VKRLRCYLGLHRWTTHVKAGERWFECSDCGKYADPAAAIMGRRDL
jgi:hypothetical protein